MYYYYGRNLSYVYNRTLASNVQKTTTQISNTTTLNGVYSLPYARSIPIVAEVTGMKPYSTLHSFIDNHNIDANIYPCAQITITGESGVFLGYKDVSPSNTWSALRSITTFDYQGNLQSIYPNGKWQHNNTLAKGETIRFYVTPTHFIAAVVISRQVQIISNVVSTVLHVALMRNYYTSSAYTDNFTSYTFSSTWNDAPLPLGSVVKGDVSGATGTVSAVSIPATGVINTNSNGNFFGVYLIPPGIIRTGNHSIQFSDSITNDSSSLTSASSDFTSLGELDSYTNTIVNKVDTFVTNTVSRIVYSDPVAETFTIPASKTDGVFVTSVDLFFSNKNPNETQPVIVELCETVNGYPSANVLFNGVALMSPDKINTSSNASIATRFYFQGPVFLQPGIEYCIKVLSNSTSYRVFVAQMGEPNIKDPSKTITQQPYLGVFFQSQNNSAWTANQLMDLTFNLNCAQFNTSSVGLLTVQNQSNIAALSSMPANPFQVGNGTTLVKVHYPDHGLPVGGLVTFSSSNATIFNGTFSVTKVINSDYFTIVVGTPQLFNGLTGGNTVLATKNLRYDSLMLTLGQDYSLKNGTAIGTNVLMSTSGGKDTTSTTVDFTTEYVLKNGTRYIHSDLNENLFLGGKKSIDVNISLSSKSIDLSPVLNINSLSLMTRSNKINNPLLTDSVSVDNHTIISTLAGVTFTASTGIVGIPTTVDLTQFKIGSFITISGTTSNNSTTQIIGIDKTTSPYSVFVNGTLLNETPTATTIVQEEGYISEIAPIGGTSESKYQTTPISLAKPATGLQIMFSAVIPPSAAVQLYYRTLNSSSNKKINDIVWVPATMSYTTSQDQDFVDQTYTVNALSSFNIAQFKVVMTTIDTTQVPKLKDFRTICLA